MKLEDFIRTKYDLKSETGFNVICIRLNRVGSESVLVILPQFIEHFYDMGDRGYLVGKAKQLYEETKTMKEYIIEV